MANNGRCARVYALIGFAAKKGSLVSGSAACEQAIRSGRKGLAVLSGDSSAGTRGKFAQLLAATGGGQGTGQGGEAGNGPRSQPGSGPGYVVFGSSGELGRRAGKGGRSILLITDTGLSGGILELLGIAHKTEV